MNPVYLFRCFSSDGKAEASDSKSVSDFKTEGALIVTPAIFNVAPFFLPEKHKGADETWCLVFQNTGQWELNLKIKEQSNIEFSLCCRSYWWLPKMLQTNEEKLRVSCVSVL